MTGMLLGGIIVSEHTVIRATILMTSENVPHPHTSIRTTDRKPAYGMWWKPTDSDEQIGAAMRKFIEAAVAHTEKING